MSLPFLSCLCPTYKRPEFLANAVACFEVQDYPCALRELIVLDDAGQYDSFLREASDAAPGLLMISTTRKLPSLAAIYNALAAEAQGDVLVVWEDDDIYLPDHLAAIAAAYAQGGEFLTPSHVYSTYGQTTGEVVREPADGRFHASWGFSRGLFDRVGGYPEAAEGEQPDFDLQMGGRLRAAGKHVRHGDPQHPTYVYRWPGVPFHFSQAGGTQFPAQRERVRKLPAPFVGAVVPRFDAETRAVLQTLDSTPRTESA